MQTELQDTPKPSNEELESPEKRFLKKLSLLRDDFSKGIEPALIEALVACQYGMFFNSRNEIEAEFEDRLIQVPIWAVQAAVERVWEYLLVAKSGKKGRGGKKLSQFFKDRLDYWRYRTVVDLLEKRKQAEEFMENYGYQYGTYWPSVHEKYLDIKWGRNLFEEAANILKRKYEMAMRNGVKSPLLEGLNRSAKTIEKSYYTVKDNIEKEPHRYRVYEHLLL